MHISDPLYLSLRQIYSLGNDRFWFAVAVLASLLAAGELSEWLLKAFVPATDTLTRL